MLSVHIIECISLRPLSSWPLCTLFLAKLYNTPKNHTQSFDRQARPSTNNYHSALNPHCTVIILIVHSRYVLMSRTIHRMQFHIYPYTDNHFTSGFRHNYTNNYHPAIHRPPSSTYTDLFNMVSLPIRIVLLSHTTKLNYNKRLLLWAAISHTNTSPHHSAHHVKPTMSSFLNPFYAKNTSTYPHTEGGGSFYLHICCMTNRVEYSVLGFV